MWVQIFLIYVLLSHITISLGLFQVLNVTGYSPWGCLLGLFILNVIWINKSNFLGFQNETELFEDTFTLPEFPSFPSKVGSSEDEFVDSDDPSISRRHITQNITFPDMKLVTASPRIMKREFKRRHVPHGWLYKLVLTYSLKLLNCLTLSRMFSNVAFILLHMWVESYLNLIHLLILNWRWDCLNWVI